MAKLANKLMDKALGGRDPNTEGVRRALAGLRLADTRELYIGLALTAFAYLQRSKPKRKLLYRKTVAPGSAIVIHHKNWGDPKIEVIKPGS